MALEIMSSSRCFGGRQLICRHASAETRTPMRFAAYLPPAAEAGKVPVVWFLAGLTCTEENFTVKAGAQRVAAQLGLMLLAPDTSPRGEGVPDDPEGAYDFGLGAGFYLDALQPPWAVNYRMRSYLERELPDMVGAELPADMGRQSIMGHSMGGHGALTMGLREPHRFKAVSAFAPIVSAMNCPWGRKALSNYLGEEGAAWRDYDACALIEDGARLPEILVDQGSADPYLEKELKPQLLQQACAGAGIPLSLRLREGYDHSYYFISSFIEDQLRWHAERLG